MYLGIKSHLPILLKGFDCKFKDIVVGNPGRTIISVLNSQNKVSQYVYDDGVLEFIKPSYYLNENKQKVEFTVS